VAVFAWREVYVGPYRFARLHRNPREGLKRASEQRAWKAPIVMKTSVALDPDSERRRGFGTTSTLRINSMMEMARAKRSMLSRSGKSRPSIGPQDIIQIKSVRHDSVMKAKYSLTTSLFLLNAP